MKIKIGDLLKVCYVDCKHHDSPYCFMGIAVETTYADFFSIMTTEGKIRIINIKEDKVVKVSTI